ncbi:MAG: LCP family protein [Erysipelotrichaceae bacterium]|nr:LCP family protein [Erysipelotrichaceae bacterium]
MKKLMNLKKKKQTPITTEKKRSRLTKNSILTLAALLVLVIAHIAILLILWWSWRYRAIYPTLYAAVFAILLLFMLIIDIVFFVGFNHNDLALKIVSSVLALFLMVGGVGGSYYLAKTNSIVNNVFDDGTSDKYETFSGVFVCYNKYNTFHSVEELAGQRVGMLKETSNGITYLAQKILADAKIDYATVDYNTNTELMTALIDGDVDAIVINSGYRKIYGDNEDTAAAPAEEETEDVEASEEDGEEGYVIDEGESSPFAIYMKDLIDFNPFEEEMKIENTKTIKNVMTDPFNVLLIGYSRTDIGSPVGLADSIIVATINPQTYTVSMTSIARDSFVPIPCYGGEYDKINSGRSTSRACFIETVEDFLGMDMDYYMELDYLGLVQIVNAIGGIYINNPVEFTLDGIYVPAGDHVFADGQMALQFCRERHHMPNGDFDRQKHQKEVIIAIAKKLVSSGDLTLALNAMDEASDWMSTDMPLSQLTTVFNMLLNTRNYTGLDTFDLIEFDNTRITGYGGIMYYSYSMRLPLWVYLVYQGSYDDSLEHINNVMGRYDTINQKNNLIFSMDNEYIRPDLISSDYENNFLFTPDPMPAYWQTLVGLTESQARSWAAANGVSLTTKYIRKGEAGYDADYAGLVYEQSARYGSLVSEYPSGTIYVMGPNEIDESKMVPDFIGHSVKTAKEWGAKYNVKIKVKYDVDLDGPVGKIAVQKPEPYTPIDELEENTVTVYVKAGQYEIKFDRNGHGNKDDVPKTITVTTGDDPVALKSMPNVKDDNGDTWIFKGWYDNKECKGEKITSTAQVSGATTLYAKWEYSHQHDWGEWKTTKEATCTEAGEKTRTCKNSKCNETETEVIPAKGHDWGDWTTTSEATCTQGGSREHTCKRCGTTESESTSALGHDYQVVNHVDPTCESTGSNTYECSRCHDTYTEELAMLSGSACETPDPGEDGDSYNPGNIRRRKRAIN